MGIRFGKVSLVAVCTCFIFFCSNLRMRAAVNDSITSQQDSKSYQMEDSSANDKVTFSSSGAISSTSNNSTPAINITVQGGVALTPENLFTLMFANDPLVNTAITNAAGEQVLAHVYATNVTNYQMAVGVRLAPGVNLTIDADKENGVAKYRPTIAAYSSTTTSGAAVGLWAAGGTAEANKNVLTFAAPVSIYGRSIASASGNWADATASAIGTANYKSDTSAPVNNLTATFVDNNTLSASATSSSSGNSSNVRSGAVAIGAAASAVYSPTNSFVNNLTATFGNGNTLSASADATATSSGNQYGAHSGAAVIGTAVGFFGSNGS
ncbi:MAG: hypothetical protein LBB15_00555, partial [Puniceicoccales bacterium]|nr:hypothetical protein [Puniceicoccales bacterium]